MAWERREVEEVLILSKMQSKIIPNIIYDDRKFEDYPIIIDEMNRQGITEYNIIKPVYHKIVVNSINLTQKSIVREAKERGDEMVCIMEQDIWFPNKSGWKYFLENIPADFDMYSGGTYGIDTRFEYKPPVVKVNLFIGHHCVIVHSKYYDKFLETNETKHIDTEQEGKGDFYVCFPFAALQRPGYSFNNRDKVDYNSILKPEYIYR
jgi:hypothetical protein